MLKIQKTIFVMKPRFSTILIICQLYSSFCFQAAYRTLREVFPTKSWRYLRDKAVNWSGGSVDALVEQLLMNSENNSEEDNDSVIVLNDTDGGVEDAEGSNDDGLTADNSLLAEEIVQDHPGQSSSTSISSPTAGQGIIENNYSTLCSMFPDVSPVYMLEQARTIGNDPVKLQVIISNSVERKSSLPSRKNFDLQQAKQKEEKKIRGMKVQDFMSEFVDPHQHFLDTTTVVGEKYKAHALFYITKHFPSIPLSEVQKVMEQNNGHFLPTIRQVEKILPSKKGKKVVKNPQNL